MLFVYYLIDYLTYYFVIIILHEATSLASLRYNSLSIYYAYKVTLILADYHRFGRIFRPVLRRRSETPPQKRSQYAYLPGRRRLSLLTVTVYLQSIKVAPPPGIGHHLLSDVTHKLMAISAKFSFADIGQTFLISPWSNVSKIILSLTVSREQRGVYRNKNTGTTNKLLRELKNQ